MAVVNCFTLILPGLDSYQTGVNRFWLAY